MTAAIWGVIISQGISVLAFTVIILSLKKRERKEPNAIIMNYPIKSFINFMYAGMGIVLFLAIVKLF
jgi:surface polysaccharide O-acyltransferase-like enzyme